MTANPPADDASPAIPAVPYPHQITRIVLRPSASPMPLGFFTVAIATCMVSALQMHILPAADRRAVALVILPAFILQVIVGAFALVDRDTIAATVMASFAATWLVDALMFFTNPVGAADTLALFFFVFAVFIFMMAVAARPKRALFVVLAVAVPRFIVSGFAQATGVSWVSTLAGVLGFILAAASSYTAWALLLEDVRGRTVLPIGRQGPARAAMEGELAAQLEGVEHAAGVRRSL